MKTTLTVCGIFLIQLLLSAWAQQPSAGAMTDAYAQTARQNAQLLRQYSWTMRVAFTVKGEAKPAQLFQLRYDLNGNLQKTALTQPAEQKKRGLRGRIAEKKTEEFKSYISELADLVKRYMAPSAGSMMDFYSKAVYVPQPDGTTKASAGGFLQPTDSVAFYIDPATKAPRRFTFSTTLQQDAVTGEAEFAQIAGGPRYPARVKVNVPGKELQATVENYNFIRQAQVQTP